MRKRMVDKEMINGENGKMLRNDPYEIRLMQNLYDAAVKQLSLKFEILNNEFKVLYARNPIHHIEGRVKAIESMVAKLRKKGLPPTIEAARESINDIAGVRVVCSYIDDVYRVAEMVERQTDIEIIKRQDYIRTPNYNGYRSLHLDIRMPVYLSDRTEHVTAEIQIRTIAMDFWASLEHDIRYKVDKTKLPEGINEEMLECSGKIAEIDRKMQDMYRRINEEGPILSFGDTNMRTRFTCGAREFVNRWSEAGPTHHMAAATGRHIDTILKVAKIFNIPVDIVTR